MKLGPLRFVAALLPLAAPGPALAAEQINLDGRVVEISAVSAALSALAYEEDAAKTFAVSTSKKGEARKGDQAQSYEHPDFDYLHIYSRDPDSAIVARRGGRCYIAFRGTVGTLRRGVELFLEDWEQNVDLGDRTIHPDGDSSRPGCEVRRGFADFIDTPEAEEGLEDVLRCMDDCKGKKDCLVVTGHSQGGATATIASILLYKWNPTVVTFGQPPAVDPGCEWIPSERFYRYINSKVGQIASNDVGIDVVPYVPTTVSGSVHYGHTLLLGDDVDGSSAIKYLGFNEIDFEPDLVDLAVDAHKMAAADASYSYEARINLIAQTFQNADAKNSYVVTDGFSDGAVCEYEELCRSGRCQDNVCTSSAHAIIACQSKKLVILSNLVGLYSMM